MTEYVQVVVVGGGIVGCSVLYGLARLGWTDTLLLEKRALTSGSTWHAAGNVTYFGHYSSVTQLYVNSVKVYLQAERESGQSVGFHDAGSLRLATTKAELDAYRRLAPMYEQLDIEYEVIGPDDIEKAHPLVVTDGLYGAAHTPTDGHVDASGATNALAKAARLRGARLKCRCPVLHIQKHATGGWRLNTPEDEIHAEHVVIANSFWARELAETMGLRLPLYALEHHEVVTDSVPALEALGFEVPTVRDPHAPSNTRQEGTGFLCGVYEANPKAWAIEGIPPDFAEELLVPDLERLEPHLVRVMERIPALASVGIKVVNNGPICYTPDGCPLLGPVNDCPGLWLATGFCVGIGTGGGSGEFLAHWIVNDAPPHDLPVVYPSRFSDDLSRAACLDAIKQTYAKGYVLPEVA